MVSAVTIRSVKSRLRRNRVTRLQRVLRCFVFVAALATAPLAAAAYHAGLSATPNPSTGDYTLTWNAVQTGRYRVQERPAGTSGWTLLYTTSQATTSYNIVNQPNGVYEYSVWRRYVICTGGGRGGCTTYIETSEVISVTVQDPAPTVPDAPITNLISLDGSYPISWNAVSGATSYKLDERSSGGLWSQIYSGSATSHSVSGRPTSTQEYRVKACNSSTCSAPSSSTAIDVEIVSGLNSEPWFATAIAGSTPFAASVDRKGSSTISVPLRLPNGVNGLAPQLGLTYSSGASPALIESNKSEGELGYGWQLSGISEIRRCRVGLPNSDIAYDSTDRLCLGGNALVAVAGGGYWADDAEYRTELNTFSKIVARGTGLVNRYFEVTLANGNVVKFGDTDASRLVSPTKTDPYLWSQRLVTDNFGNAISYTWHEISITGTNYLIAIDYAGARVEFRYEDRCKSLTDCDIDKVQNGESIPGIKVQAVVLNRILTKFDGEWVGDYRLDNNYVNGYLRLERLQQCGANEAGSAWRCMSPLQFAWDTLTLNDSASSLSTSLLVVDEVTNSFGDKTYFDYAVIDGHGTGNHALHVSRHAEFPSKPLPGNVGTSTRQRAVVQFVRHPNGNGGTTTTQFKYQDYPLFDNAGRGFVGFAAVYSEFYNQSQFDPATESSFTAHRRQYRQFRFDFPYIGFEGRQITEVDTNPGTGYTWTRVSKTYNKYAVWTSHSLSVKFPFLQTKYIHNPELRADNSLGYGNALRIGTSYCWRVVDSNGVCPVSGSVFEYPTQVRTMRSSGLYIDGADNLNDWWGEVKFNVSLALPTHIQTQTSDFSNIPASWNNGFVSRSEVGWGVLTATESQDVHFSRDATTHNKPGVIQYFDGDPNYDRTVSLTYDTNGNLTNTNDTGINQVTSASSSSSYLHNRYPQTVTNAENHSSTLAYDLRFGTANSVTDPNGDISTVTRDEFGRVVSSQAPDGTVTTTTYSSCTSGCAAVTWATPRLKVTRTYTNNGAQVAPDEVAYLDTRGLTVLTEVEAFSAGDGWVRTQLHYDAVGRLTKQSLPYFSVGGTVKFVERFYDYKGREVFVSRPDGSDIEREIYADAGTGGHVNIEVTETGQNRTKRYRYDRVGRLVDTTDGFGTTDAVTTAYTYTLRGELETVRVDGVLVADIDYDTARNRDTLWEPNSGTTSFDYYSNHLLEDTTDANSNTTRFVYDALGRLEQRVDGYGGGSPVTNAWTWDTALNGKGRLASRTNGPAGSRFTETYTYDGAGRLDTVTAAIDVTGFNDNGNYVTDYGYDANGRLSTIAYPNLTVTNVYNGLGYLSQVKKGAAVLHQYTDVDAFGNITGESYGNGLETARGYDANTGRLTSIQTGTSGLPKSVQDLVYDWQTDGALYQRIDKKGTSGTGDDLVETFLYDEVGRLTSAGTALGGRDLTFTYDDHGNLLSKLSDIGGDLDVTSYSYPATTPAKPHRLSTVSIGGISNTLSYDSAGNITRYNATSGDDTFLDYDKASRVAKITVGSSSTDTTPTARDEFWYGPDGQRFLRKASWMDSSTLKTSWTLYLMGGVFEEVHPMHHATVDYRQRVLVTSNVLHRYVKYSSSTTTAIEYLHRDHLGSIATTTNSSGTAIRRTDFDPFGRQRDDDWNSDISAVDLAVLAGDEDVYQGRGFTDHEMLNRTGFVHMNGRVYDSRIGRFVQPDPIVGRPDIADNYNRYAYVLNSPMSATDPTGLDGCGWDHCGVTISIGFGIGTSGERPISGFDYDTYNPYMEVGQSSPPVYGVPGTLENVWDFYSCNVLGLCGGAGGYRGFGGGKIPGFGGDVSLGGVGTGGLGFTEELDAKTIFKDEFRKQLFERLRSEAERVVGEQQKMLDKDRVNIYGPWQVSSVDIHVDQLDRFATRVDIGILGDRLTEIAIRIALRKLPRAKTIVPNARRPSRKLPKPEFDLSGWIGDCPGKSTIWAGHCGFFDPNGNFHDVNDILPPIMRGGNEEHSPF